MYLFNCYLNLKINFISASQVSLYPTINLVMYVMPCKEAPIYIYGKDGRRIRKGEPEFEAFHSPRYELTKKKYFIKKIYNLK